MARSTSCCVAEGAKAGVKEMAGESILAGKVIRVNSVFKSLSSWVSCCHSGYGFDDTGVCIITIHLKQGVEWG